ncbi:hypothetical protein ACIHAR_36240 [Streptomyces sp. NPDC052016]|uniref:hypothetical protein n=1 Tax=Streptomyces sp. NPDC052016 TaxID=3365680 RepID=UPI0037D82A8A
MQHRRPRFSKGGEGPHRHRGRPRGRRRRHRARAQALVRRNPLGDDEYVSGIGAGTEVFKGCGRPDTVSRSVGVG